MNTALKMGMESAESHQVAQWIVLRLTRRETPASLGKANLDTVTICGVPLVVSLHPGATCVLMLWSYPELHMRQGSEGAELWRTGATRRVKFASRWVSPGRVRLVLQSAAAFTHIETAVDESEHGNSSAVSETKTLGSCHSVEAATVFGKEQFPIMHSSIHDCSRSQTFLQNPSASFNPFVCLQKCWLLSTESPEKSSKSKQRYSRWALWERKGKIACFSLEMVEKVRNIL